MSAGDAALGSTNPEVNLTRSTASGVKWNFVSQTGQQVAQLLTTVVLARMLAPSDFGLLGMALIVTGFVTLFKDMGTSAAVIRSHAAEPELLSTIFWANTAIGMLACLLLVGIAPGISAFYHAPALTDILRVLAINFLVSGASNLHKAWLERKLAFRALAGVELLSVLAGMVAGIGTAVLGAGVWALVAQSLASTTLMTFLLWVASGYRPTWSFSWQQLRAVAGFSLNLTGFNAFNYAVRNADNLLIGRFFGAAPLGLYALAYRIMLFPMQSVTYVVSRVMFPVYSRIQDDDARLRSAFARTAGMIALVTFPLMTGICALARPFVLTIFGSQWMAAIPLVRLLAPIGMIQSVTATVGAIFQAKGRTDLLFRWGVFSGLFIVLAFFIGLRWGIQGVAVAYAIASSLLLLPNLLIAFRLIRMRLVEVAVPLIRPLSASLLMVSGILALEDRIPSFHGIPAFAFQIVLGGALYIAASLLLNHRQMRDALTLILNRAQGV